jgi:hypothetical protein
VTPVSRVQRNGEAGTGRFVRDGTPEEAPRAPAGTAAAPSRDAHGRPVGGGDDPALREPFLALARPGCRARGGGPCSRRVTGGREATACPDGRGRCGEPLVRARDGGRRRRTDSAEAACGSHRVRSNHARARGRPTRLARHPRAAAGRDLARFRRPDRARDHARAAALVRSRLRARSCRPRACGRLAGHPRARWTADRLRPLLHAAFRRHGSAACIGIRLRPRDLPAALSRRRAPLLRPGRPCRLGAPTEEAQCRRTSCCPA